MSTTRGSATITLPTNGIVTPTSTDSIGTKAPTNDVVTPTSTDSNAKSATISAPVQVPTPDDNDAALVGGIVGGILAFLCIIALIVALIVARRRRNRTMAEKSRSEPRPATNGAVYGSMPLNNGGDGIIGTDYKEMPAENLYGSPNAAHPHTEYSQFNE
jgi:hypothetical protein